jgi:hypothetical protein
MKPLPRWYCVDCGAAQTGHRLDHQAALHPDAYGKQSEPMAEEENDDQEMLCMTQATFEYLIGKAQSKGFDRGYSAAKGDARRALTNVKPTSLEWETYQGWHLLAEELSHA